MTIARAISVEIDLCPTENGAAFDAWCEKYDFHPLNSGRRAWCSSFNTYLRDAIGVATTRSGESFLIWTEDLPIE
jgi:hypothetical protein